MGMPFRPSHPHRIVPHLLLTVTAVAFAGCAHAPAPVARVAEPSVAQPQPAPSQPAIGGVYEWVFESRDDQGDVRLEQEEWHITQRGNDIDGWYDRAVTVRSTDDRLYRCNKKLGFTKFTRVQVAGTIEGERMRLRETAYKTKPDPCDDGARTLQEYVGVVEGISIKLKWEANRGQTLYRREAKGRPNLAQLAGITEEHLGPIAVAVRRSAVPVSGDWEWELRSVDAEGDQRVEREVWHLEDGADGISGHYDRHVMRVRSDGIYPCNQADRFESVTRYRIHGQRIGDKVTLQEVDYSVSGATRCDPGQRRLDHYEGTVGTDGDEIVLSWGSGNQLLRRQPAK